MHAKEPMYTAIVAAYNVEKYIGSCLDSILKIQDDNLEIIIVTGRKTDQTNHICEEYSLRENIKLIRQNGVGLSNARNCGINEATGQYIFFVDGDDSVDSQKLKKFLSNASKLIQGQKVDAILNDFYFTTETGSVLIENNQIPAGDFSNFRYAEKIIKSKGTFWNSWRFLFSKTFIKERRLYFKENSTCEDLEFAVRLFTMTNHLWFCHIPYYQYCPVRNDSLMNSKNYEMIRDFFGVQNDLRYLLKHTEFKLTSVIISKLNELVILCLPDIYEVDKNDRKRCAVEYQKFARKASVSSGGIQKFIFRIMKTDGVYMLSYLLYYIKKIRRKKRYKV